ncbi:hypothetical protein ACN24L_06940 [Streptomyces microflavus]
MSHVVAGGRLPGAGVLALLFLALSVEGALLFGGRRRRFDVVTLVLGSTQFALHGAFHFLSAAPGGAQRSGMPAGHEHPVAGHSGGHVMDAGMTLAHGAATLGTALCVIHGERVLRRLAALVVPASPSGPCRRSLPSPAAPGAAGGRAERVRGARPLPPPAWAAVGGRGLTASPPSFGRRM